MRLCNTTYPVWGICPAGWYLPTDKVALLTTYLEGESVAGGAMKETGLPVTDPNAGATNSSGFNALPGGNRSDAGIFSCLT